MTSAIPYILYDDSTNSAFGPLTELRRPSDLRCGAFTLEEKLLRRLRSAGAAQIFAPGDGLTHPRFELATLGETPLATFVSSTAILTQEAADQIAEARTESVFENSDHEVLGACLGATRINQLARDWPGIVIEDAIRGLPRKQINGLHARYPWQLVNWVGEQVAADLQIAESESNSVPLPLPVETQVRNAENLGVTGDVYIGPGIVFDASAYPIRLEEGCRIEAGAILAALDGPIWIDRRARIMPGAIVSGPAYIGPDSIIRQGARLNGEIALGPFCRVGGELSGVIMQGYSNKQHSGYLGTSFLGEWVNLGAATDNSDLKNNYRPIEVVLEGRKIDSGSLHVGVFLGDFVRTAIQTRLNSGTAVGSCCNLFGSDFPDKAVPPFIWAASDGYQVYKIEKALETIRTVMERRKRRLTPDHEAMLRKLYADTEEVRGEFIRKQGKN